MRGTAKELGYKLNEKGIFKGDKRIKCTKEEFRIHIGWLI